MREARVSLAARVLLALAAMLAAAPLRPPQALGGFAILQPPLALAAVTPKPPASRTPAPSLSEPTAVRIMPLGDGVTQADNKHASYRYWLYKDLVRLGYNPVFVGSQTDNYNGKPPHNDFDAHHEGHWDWTTAQIAEKISEYATVKPPGAPQYVLITLGAVNPDPPAAAAADLEKIIDALRKANPRVAVLLAQCIPSSGPAAADKFAALNQAIVALAARKNNLKTAPVLTVDLNSKFDAATLLYDGVHPNENGEKFIADRFLAALLPLLEKEGPIHGHNLVGHLAKFRNFLATNDYGGIGAEIDEMMAGNVLQAQELSEAADLMNDIGIYAAVQKQRIKNLVAQNRYYDAGPLAQKLASQFRGIIGVGYEPADLLAAWRKSPATARELAAGGDMTFIRTALLAGRYSEAYDRCQSVIRGHAGTQAGREAQRIADDLEKRDLSRGK